MSHILVVDDDSGLRKMLRLLLQRGGYVVDEAQDGAEALSKVLAVSYDAALVDYQMPALDGLELLTRLREIQPRCVRLLMSGALDLPTIMDAINRGEVTRVIQKPFQRQAILRALEEAVAVRSRMEDLCIGALNDGFESQRRNLEECLTTPKLALAIQPIVAATDGAVRGYEALLRSSHPVLDTAPRVVAAAEAHEMLDRLGTRVAELAAALIGRIPAGANLFINVHPGELVDADRVRERFEQLRPWANRIVVEITERSHVLQIVNWRHAVDFLTRTGFRIAVDDVGAGYNSLSVLAELKPAFVKVDMSIVRDIDRDERKQRLVELLSRFAAATNAQLVVEGIETQAEAAVIRRIGADLLQGYLFGYPTVPQHDARPAAAPETSATS